MRRTVLLAFWLFLAFLPTNPIFSQGPKAQPSAAELFHQLKKLNVLGSVLYVAAHPDDENQRLISYFANEKLYDVTYISLTRGDGGQNLIGPEIRELLGVLRTEELLAARRVDGGKQLFSRANDFGFSKDPNETMRIWDHDLLLEDVIRAFRATRPDVVVNRFDHNYNTKTHGHHTASAMLAVEAFEKSANPTIYPSLAKQYGVWQPSRIFFNTSAFFFGGEEAFAKVDKSDMLSVDVGTFLPVLGKSNSEIAAEARSQHRCQGFGAALVRGTRMEYLKYIAGAPVRPGQEPLHGIRTDWGRIKGGEAIGKALEKAIKNYQIQNPAASVPALLNVMDLLEKMPDDGFWKTKKMADLQQLILQCSGFFLEVSASDAAASPGDSLQLKIECLDRNSVSPISLLELRFLPSGEVWKPTKPLLPNTEWIENKTIRIDTKEGYSAPYWLVEPGTVGMFAVPNEDWIGLPNTPRSLQVQARMRMGNGREMTVTRPILYKKTDPAKGEIHQPFEVVPPVFVELTESMTLATGESTAVSAVVTAGKKGIKGTLRPVLPEGWRSEPSDFAFDLKEKGSTSRVVFTVFPAKNAPRSEISLTAQVEGKTYDKKRVLVEYDHIPTQTVLLPSTAWVVPMDLELSARRVGYYHGAGDALPELLRQMGCTVDILTDQDLNVERLSSFDAVVLGIRAYNTQDKLAISKDALLGYVQAGGTLIVQYNTNFRLVQEDFAPYSLKLSRDRVTEEDAPVSLLLPEHPCLQKPNRITTADFEGWVQERGLYFPSEWAAEWAAPLAMADTGMPTSQGSLLVAPYGKGHYVYTGISFFRQMPEGVPGAIRLFANLLSL